MEDWSVGAQKEFLGKFWQRRFDSGVNREHLQKLASSCLANLKVNESERSLLDIPLQCKLLAQVHLNDAKNSILLEATSTTDIIIERPVLSIFELYKRHMENCFNKIDKSSKMAAVSFHRQEAFKLLYPKFLSPDTLQSLSSDTILEIGLLETSPVNESDTQFVHIAFAEYLVAEFLAECITNNEFLGMQSFITTADETTLLFQTALMSVTYAGSHDLTYKFASPTTAFLFNERLRENDISQNLTNVQDIFEKSKFNDPELIFQKMGCSLHHNCHEIFKILKHLYLNSEIIKAQETGTLLRWSQLIQVAAKYSSGSLFQDFCEFVEKMEGIPVHEMHAGKIFGNSFEDTPLHTSLRSGNSQTFEYLIPAYINKLSTLQLLMHACVEESYDNSDEVISNKIEMIKQLALIHKSSLEEKDRYQFHQSPLLSRKVSYRLLECLISEGANIFEMDQRKRNLAHICAEYLSSAEYTKLVKILIINDGSELFSSRDWYLSNRTPIHNVMQCMEVSLETLRLLTQTAKVTFNNEDNNGDTEFFQAIKSGRSRKLLERMIELGADWKWKNKWKQTPLHVASISGNLGATCLLLFHGANPNARNNHERTPLHWIAGAPNKSLCHVAKLLLDRGAKVNAVDEDGYTPLKILELAGGDPELGELIRAYGGKSERDQTLPFLSRCWSRCLAAVTVILVYK